MNQADIDNFLEFIFCNDYQKTFFFDVSVFGNISIHTKTENKRTVAIIYYYQDGSYSLVKENQSERLNITNWQSLENELKPYLEQKGEEEKYKESTNFLLKRFTRKLMKDEKNKQIYEIYKSFVG